MLMTVATTRFSAAQLGEAISRSARGGDARFFLLEALRAMPGDAVDDVLIHLLDGGDLQAREWFTVCRELAQRHPGTYLRSTLRQGLGSRSIGVQEVVIAELPNWARAGLLAHEDLGVARGWVDKRLRNPRRAATAAIWEVVDVALAIAIIEGPAVADTALTRWAPRLLDDERQRVAALPPPSSVTIMKGLEEWSGITKFGGEDPSGSYKDPTATRYIDRVMRRLKIEPVNPEAEIFVEAWESFEPMTVDEFSSEPVSEQLDRVFGSLAAESQNLGTETRHL